MKKLFSAKINEASVHISLLLLRVFVSIFMITHGVPKLNKALSGNMQFSDPFGVGAEISLGLAIFSELICSIFVFIGLGTRLASVPLIITMFVAGFIVHGDDPFKKKELALMYLLIYLVLFIAGSGKYSVDRLLKK